MFCRISFFIDTPGEQQLPINQHRSISTENRIAKNVQKPTPSSITIKKKQTKKPDLKWRFKADTVDFYRNAVPIFSAYIGSVETCSMTYENRKSHNYQNKGDCRHYTSPIFDQILFIMILN